MKSHQVVVAFSVLLLLIAFVIAALSDNENAEQAKRLASRDRESKAALRRADPNVGKIDERMLRLSETLLAESESTGDEVRQIWTVSSSQGPVTVIVPFRPDQTISNSSPADLSSMTDDGNGQTSAAVSPIVPLRTRNDSGFVGAEACNQCHQEKHQGFVETAHHKTSALATSTSVRGPREPVAKELLAKMWPFQINVNKLANRFVQRIESDDWTLDIPMDIVTGSAKSGQTYLYWSGDALFQDFISYLSPSNEWIPSPGYSASEIDFSRQIQSACLECHITYIESQADPSLFHRDTAILGISCERCHGPGQQHVDFHQTHPQQPSQFITLPSRLARTEQLEICGQCHSGLFTLRKPAFSFRPGDNLDEFHKIKNAGEQAGGVHTSNQRSRLVQSQCFKNSEMVCTTCHDPHHNERGNTALFSKRCLQCHTVTHPTIAENVDNRFGKNCIDCHMPETVDKQMSMITRAGVHFDSMADHLIRIDQAASEKFIANLGAIDTPQ